MAADLDVTLLDDGTLDTVVEVTYGDETVELRYSMEVASDYRDPVTGALDEDAFFEYVREDVEASWPFMTD